ncbi:hypothetical protein, partial [Klebsiella pneumoniae]|uniref:hypothetical protein n=1 Tax=Klebsiella pneumoniae TaxID=573 RepID=UPI002731429B
SDFQRGMLALRKRDIIAARTKAEATPAKNTSTEENEGAAASDAPATGDDPGHADDNTGRIKTREDFARAAGISSATIG